MYNEYLDVGCSMVLMGFPPFEIAHSMHGILSSFMLTL
jgi:hypothetical protein